MRGITAVQIRRWEALPGFAELKQKRNKTPAGWVAVAQQLAKKNKGVLPRGQWLKDNGYYGLYACMRAYPELFKSFEREMGRKAPEQWLAIARQLAKDNGGMLPCHSWLRDNGYDSLAKCKSDHPELFVDIEQETKRTTPEQWVVTAEQLVKKHGVLPSLSWLHDNGYIGLVMCKRTYPKLFKHIKQDFKGGRTSAENVALAKTLAKENKGVLPCFAWLRDNGHGSLTKCMSDHPELFADIEQEKKNKSPEQWVTPAEQLAKDNGGVLPTRRWLSKNGYSGLATLKYDSLPLFQKKFKKVGGFHGKWILKTKRGGNHGH